MGTVIAAASALVVTVSGAAAALSAPFGAAGHGGQYLAGHVLLGLGLGHSAAILLRIAFKRLAAGRVVRRKDGPSASAADAVVSTLPVRPATIPPATPVSAPVVRLAPARVTSLPSPHAAMAPMRGRHAA